MREREKVGYTWDKISRNILIKSNRDTQLDLLINKRDPTECHDYSLTREIQLSVTITL
jgi:hypothetical protein